MKQKIRDLLKARKAILLAHNYQNPEVQDVANFVGDSLGLAQQAAATDARTRGGHLSHRSVYSVR